MHDDILKCYRAPDNQTLGGEGRQTLKLQLFRVVARATAPPCLPTSLRRSFPPSLQGERGEGAHANFQKNSAPEGEGR